MHDIATGITRIIIGEVIMSMDLAFPHPETMTMHVHA